MTTRGQILRSSTPGNVPAAGSRAPGELWVTFPDLQLGLIDTTKTAQRLIAIRYFSTLANYAVGEFVVQAGKLYVATSSVSAGAFNSGQWAQIAKTTDIPAVYVLPTASTSVLGGVMIDGTTVKINSGVISASGLAAVATTPPGSPQNGSQWFDLIGGQLYVWVNDGTSSQWVVAVNQSLGGVYLPMTGGTLTGPLTLAGDPVNPLDAVTKQYADGHAINDNRLINGDMRIAQRGASGTVAGYTVDRWRLTMNQAGKLSWSSTGSAAMTSNGFPACLTLTSLSAYAALAADQFAVWQAIEADMVSDFAWGTANAQPVTLSFWFNGSAGTYSGSVQNYATTRSYPFTFNLPATGWSKIVLTIPGDTGGTWVMSGNGGALYLNFDLGSGANNRGAATGAWQNTNVSGVTGTMSVVATNGAAVQITGVKLELGSVATPYNRQSLAKSMADCQRYYASMFVFFTGYQLGSTGFGQTVTWPVTMRGNPTVTFVSPAYINASNIANSANGLSSGAFSATATATGTVNAQATMTLSAEL